MANEKTTILLFEDSDKLFKKFEKAVGHYLGDDLRFERFDLTAKPHAESGTYEDRLSAELLKRPDYSQLTLVVTDRDLSTASPQWRGLSEASVSRAAKALGIPVACYRESRDDTEDRLRRIAGDGLIELPPLMEDRGRKVAVLARGFVKLDAMVHSENALAPKKSKRSSPTLPSSPGALLASILGQPVIAPRLDTFACRDETAIAEIVRASGEKQNVTPAIKRRLIVALGVWLADLVMVYPGILLNETAAASYLDIDPVSFKRDDVRKVFAGAQYKNLPFADDEAPMWWRHLLDDVVTEEGVETGLEACKKKGLKRLKFCRCSIDPTLHAGYYCMASFEPLSAKNSSGRVRWFPQGADLARLTKRTYQKLGPWIGS